jgi:hypothetical protein
MKHSLPIPPDELARQLSVALAPRPNGLQLTVDSLLLTEAAERVDLRLDVIVTRATSPEERWQLTIPVPAADLDSDVLGPGAFVFTIRANIEEWWDVKDHEPSVAAWGRRMS